ncbi:MAG: transporter substrate-binding domain-containing protein [Oscillospiraceae bacterium]|jgi:polar amino acid transport system substrate-binding protein|nr:transporter substrate-binding domain-containing protein [Oscillospiraceae bacterium]
MTSAYAWIYNALCANIKRAGALLAAAALIVSSGCGEKLAPNTVVSPGDISGKAIGAISGSAGAFVASQYGEVQQFADMDVMFESLRGGALDCVVTDSLARGKNPRRVKTLRDPLAEYGFAFAVARENGDLKRAINSAIGNLRESGELSRIENAVSKGSGYEYAPPEAQGEKRATLRAAVRAEFAPYAYAGADGECAGVDIEVARAVCAALGVDGEFCVVEAGEMIDTVRYGKADFAVGGLYENEADAGLVEYSNSYATAVMEVLVRG